MKRKMSKARQLTFYPSIFLLAFCFLCGYNYLVHIQGVKQYLAFLLLIYKIVSQLCQFISIFSHMFSYKLVLEY
jgi:cytochrome c oxidase subunit IV